LLGGKWTISICPWNMWVVVVVVSRSRVKWDDVARTSSLTSRRAMARKKSHPLMCKRWCQYLEGNRFT
jgi:hypothetical protein